MLPPVTRGDPPRLSTGVMEKGKQHFQHPPKPSPSKPAAKGKGGKALLVKSETLEIASAMKEEVSGASYSFLVATLNAAGEPRQVGATTSSPASHLLLTCSSPAPHLLTSSPPLTFTTT